MRIIEYCCCCHKLHTSQLRDEIGLHRCVTVYLLIDTRLYYFHLKKVMTKLTGSARGSTNHQSIFTHSVLLRTQEAPLQGVFHNEDNTDNMTCQKWLLTKQFTILCNSPTAQLFVLDIASGRLLPKTATGTGSLLFFDMMYCRAKGA